MTDQDVERLEKAAVIMDADSVDGVTKAAAAKASTGGFSEIGSTGLRRNGLLSTIDEEFLPELRWEKGVKIYQEMRDNDAVVGAMLYAIEALVRNVKWRVEGDTQAAEFVEECMQDMSHTWEDFLAEVLSMLVFGFSWHEVIYKRRQGDGNDPTKRSRFTDGKIGWRKLAVRSQDSLQQWRFDEQGGIQAFLQSAPPEYQLVEIPIERSLLFRTTTYKGNPEGRSMLRNAYRSWYLKRRIENLEGVGVERDLAGMPVIYRTKEIASKYDDELKKILRDVKRDEQEGLLLPLAFDDKGNKALTFELLQSSGKRQLDVTSIIERYDKRIAMTVLADFILMGQQSVGSFALAESKTGLFDSALGAHLNNIASVMNRVAIPRLLAVNGMQVKDPPKIVPGDIATPDLDVLGRYITALSGAGAQLFPDDDLENHLRDVADLPEKSEDAKALQAALPEPAPPTEQKPPKGQAPEGQPPEPKPGQPLRPPLKQKGTPKAEPGAAGAKTSQNSPAKGA